MMQILDSTIPFTLPGLRKMVFQDFQSQALCFEAPCPYEIGMVPSAGLPERAGVVALNGLLRCRKKHVP